MQIPIRQAFELLERPPLTCMRKIATSLALVFEGVLPCKADEVARNGALARITSARGFLGTPLAFPRWPQSFASFEIFPESFLSARQHNLRPFVRDYAIKNTEFAPALTKKASRLYIPLRSLALPMTQGLPYLLSQIVRIKWLLNQDHLFLRQQSVFQ